MRTVRTAAELEEAVAPLRIGSIGFVPTMGALHEGHISLVEQARRENDTVVVSVFVNPTQFNDPSDLKNYPRTPERDSAMLEAAGTDILFMPSVEDVYPEPDTRVFDFGQLDKVMEGATRPGHFNGVAQVVSRLFDMVKPDNCYFGLKDFQQLAIVRELAKQTGCKARIVECDIVREADGLAMSSRNTLLAPEYRKAAPGIYAAMKRGVEKAPGMSVAETERFVISEVEKEGLLKVIYFRIADAETLAPVQDWGDSARIQGFIAVQAGPVRLIDNIRFK